MRFLIRNVELGIVFLYTFLFPLLPLAISLLSSFWAFRQAVGLSAISLLAPLSLRLAKDAAPIPNAEGKLKIENSP